jgi:hypothetical protein
MGVILWSVALLLFLFWSLAAWIIFGFSDWAASQVAGALGGVFSAEVGSWATWLINSLGTLIKLGIAAVWSIVSFGILGAPLWLRRKRRASQIPASYAQGYPFRSGPRDIRLSDHRVSDDHFGEQHQRRGDHERPWRDRDMWQQRARQSYGEVSFLRDAIGETMGKYRRKKRKKRDDDDDD